MMKAGTWYPVSSRNVAKLQWNKGNTLLVEYHDGATYRFDGIAQHTADFVKSAQSVGSALHNIGVKGVRVS